MIEAISKSDINEGLAMDVHDLKLFEAVARLGGMNRAAVELNTVQSNITARVRALEAELGCKLFVRHGRGVNVTQAGLRLLPYARRLPPLLADAARAVRDDGVPQGPLVIGSLESTLAIHLSPLLARYVAIHPDVDLTLRTGTTEELLAAILDRQIDGAFVCGPVSHTSLREDAIFREELVVLAAPGVASFDALVQEGKVRMVVLRAGCSYRHRLEAVLARRGIPAPRLLEFGTLEAIIGCVSAGLGVTLLPRELVSKMGAQARVSVHRLPPADARADTVFIRYRDDASSSALRAFFELVGTNVVRKRVA